MSSLLVRVPDEKVQVTKISATFSLWVSVHPLHGSCAEFNPPGNDLAVERRDELEPAVKQ